MKLSDWKELVKKANIIHNNQYDYNKVSYINIKTPICIVCHEKDEDVEEHGEFWQRPNDHLNGHGCRLCGITFLKKLFIKTTEQFIEKAKEIHGERYDYSKVEYKGAFVKVCIICPKHGEFWQTPNSHINSKSGCILCNNINKSENDIAELLTNHSITFERQKKFDWLGNQRLDFYLPNYNIAIEYQGEQHYKPVKYFGGEKRYIDRKERDERKLLLCQQNNVDVLYISFFKLAPNNVLKDKNELINKIKEYEFIKRNN